MIHVNIPQMPQESDYKINENDVKRAEKSMKILKTRVIIIAKTIALFHTF